VSDKIQRPRFDPWIRAEARTRCAGQFDNDEARGNADVRRGYANSLGASQRLEEIAGEDEESVVKQADRRGWRTQPGV
jgi:hypothetical protein